MKNVSPLLVNMPTDLADAMKQQAKSHRVSRTWLINEACYLLLNGKPAPTTKSIQSAWSVPNQSVLDDPDAPPSFFTNSGTGIR